jgi:hypothetical protein
MSNISSRARSKSYSQSDWENPDPGEDHPEDESQAGCEISKIDLDFTEKHQNFLIYTVNKSYSLERCFDELNVQFIDTYSPSGWSLKSSCPFPDHNDSSPSFFFNSEENIFNCFGCSRGGGPVQFLAYLRHKDPIEIAQELISHNQVLSELEKEQQDSLFSIQDLLFEFADAFFQFISKFPKAQPFADNVSKCFDFYVRNCMVQNKFNRKQLEAILIWCKEKFTNYKD